MTKAKKILIADDLCLVDIKFLSNERSALALIYLAFCVEASSVECVNFTDFGEIINSGSLRRVLRD
jgi:hypothetical protein